jgi:hypothetical protein
MVNIKSFEKSLPKVCHWAITQIGALRNKNNSNYKELPKIRIASRKLKTITFPSFIAYTITS